MSGNQNRNRNAANFYFANDFNMNTDPRKENFCSFLKWFFCPKFSINSMTFAILMINILIFTLLLMQGIKTSKITRLSFLAVEDGVLKKSGSLVLNFLFEIKSIS